MTQATKSDRNHEREQPRKGVDGKALRDTMGLMTTYEATEAELNREIESTRERLAELQKEQKRRNGLPEDQKLAEYLHSKQCRWDHTEGCSWFYEFDNSEVNWGGYAHSRYLTSARKALKSYDYSTVVGVLEVVGQ